MDSSNLRPGGPFALVFGDDAVAVTLDAPDRASAFETAQRLVKQGRPATLLEDGVPLASLSYSPEGFWTVAKLADAA